MIGWVRSIRRARVRAVSYTHLDVYKRQGYVIANQVSLYVVTNLANSGPEGTVATYQYAFAFFQLPHGLIAVSLMTAVLPRLATAFVDSDLDAFRANFREGMNVLFTVVLAASAGYVIVAKPVVQVVFQRGAFSASGTDETARTLIAFAIGLPAFSACLLYTSRCV